MQDFVHLAVAGVEEIHEDVIAREGTPGLADRGLLESAVAACQASFGGENIISNPYDIAAAYLFYICRAHAFVDGNKRTALAACLHFLKINSMLPDPAVTSKDINAWEALVIGVADGSIARQQAAVRLGELLTQKT